MGVQGLDSTIKTQSVNSIIAGWQSTLTQFRTLRRRYLLYPETPPVISSLRLVGVGHNQTELAWTALFGRTYRVYYQNGLGAFWDISGDYTGSGSVLRLTNSLALTPRFFRLELRP